MPTYEYKCKVCNAEFEVEQSIKSEAIAECPSCKVMCSNRLISKTNFVLAGSGWEKDGYASKR